MKLEMYKKNLLEHTLKIDKTLKIRELNGKRKPLTQIKIWNVYFKSRNQNKFLLKIYLHKTHTHTHIEI